MGNYAFLTSSDVVVRQDAKKGPRSTMALDCRLFFQVTADKGCHLTIQPAFEYAESAFLFVQHCCCFFFVFFLGRNFGRMPLSFFL